MTRKTGILGVALTAVLFAGCGAPAEPPANDPPPAPTPPPEAPADPTLSVSPMSGPPGGTVRITADGFPANTDVVVGIGPPNSEYEVIERVRTTADGRVTADVSVPEWTQAGRDYVWVVAGTANQPRVISDRFAVTEG